MKVLLADDRGLPLSELRCVLAARGVELLGVAKDASDCVRQARLLRPDVILMDSRMPSRSVLAATRAVVAELPRTRMYILTASLGGYDLLHAVRAGVRGFLLESVDGDDLADVVQALRSLPVVPGRAAGSRTRVQTAPAWPLDDAGDDRATAETVPLSERQEEVLTLLAQGLTYSEIADRVSLTPRTVKYHMGEIMRKLHLRNRAQVVAFGGSRGLGTRIALTAGDDAPPPCVPSGVCPFGH